MSQAVNIQINPVLQSLLDRVNQDLGDRSQIGRRPYFEGYPDQLIRNDVEINRLLIQARLIKKSITRLTNYLENPGHTLDERERVLDLIEEKRELLRLARIQVKRRKILLDQLIEVYRRTGIPDWEQGKPGIRLSDQMSELVTLGKNIRDLVESHLTNNLSNQSAADLARCISDIDKQVLVLGADQASAVQKKLLMRQKFKLAEERDALVKNAPGSAAQILNNCLNSIRPLNKMTFLPEAWHGQYPPTGLTPLQRAFQKTYQMSSEDFFPQTVRELLVEGPVSNVDRSNFVTGALSVL